MLRTVTLLAALAAVAWSQPTRAQVDPDSAKRTQPAFDCVVHQHGGKTRLRGLVDTKTGACTGFEVLDRRGRVISLHQNAIYGSGRLVSSLDGRRVMYVAEYPHAKLKRDGTFQPLDRPTRIKSTKVEVLALFFDGKKVGSYTLGDLLKRPYLVDTRPNHVQWLRGDVSFMRRAVGKSIKLTTTSFRTYTFDTETGATVHEGDSEDWRQCDAMIYGNISSGKDGICGANPYWVLKGTVPVPLHFELSSDLNFANGFQTVCLVRPELPGKTATEMIGTKLFGPLNGLALRP